MAKGMFVDTSLCIGCRACTVACKGWNELKMDKSKWTGTYQNLTSMSANTWRLVKFKEKSNGAGSLKWLMMSDSCKHCVQASCVSVCPTGALYRTAFGAVDVNQAACNGCRYCIAACPYGAVNYNEETGRVNKCTLCVTRVANGLSTACGKACPTGSIQFGDVDQLMERAKKRLVWLQEHGHTEANLYGEKELGGLNVFYLLMDDPLVYGLPKEPRYVEASVMPNWGFTLTTVIMMSAAAIVAFRERRE